MGTFKNPDVWKQNLAYQIGDFVLYNGTVYMAIKPVPAGTAMSADCWTEFAEGAIVPTGEISITENGEVNVAQYATANVNVEGGGGGGDFSTATVAVTLTAPEGKTLAETYINATVGLYSSDNLVIENGEVEVWLIQGYMTYIDDIRGNDMDLNNYVLDTSSPITSTGGVSWNDDNERFTVTGDGTISASLVLD